MTQSGTCMMNCSESENSDYGNREHPDSCTWYEAHKDDTCDGGSIGSGNNSESPYPPSSSDNGGNPSPSGDSAQSEQSQPNNNSDNDEQSQEEKDGISAANKLQLGTLIAALTVTGSVALL